MTLKGSKYAKIELETETGKLVKVVDEEGNEATKLTPEKLQEMYKTKAPKHIGYILHTHSSPD